MAQSFQAEAAGQAMSLEADSLKLPGIAHGFFLRVGGVSEGIYASLNCGRGSSDQRECVEENRARVADRLGIAPRFLIGPSQFHSRLAVIADAPWSAEQAPKADAVVSTRRGLAISVLTADCAPVLMADAKAGVIAAAHAGWKGAKAGILENVIEAMESLGARASRIAAAIGPAISQAAYEVGPDFRKAFLADAADNAKYFRQTLAQARPHFDLLAFIKDKLLRRGVGQIEDFAICTYANESILFSYRRAIHRDERDYGRQISAILLI